MGEDQGGESKESEVASSFVRCPPLPRRSRMNLAFERHIGIDYSGAETPKSSLKGLRVYAADRLTAPQEIQPPPSPRKYWSRRNIAEWLVERLSEGNRRSSASTTVSLFRCNTSSSTDCRSTGRASLTISSTIGRRTMTSTWILCARVPVVTVLPDPAILAGAG